MYANGKNRLFPEPAPISNGVGRNRRGKSALVLAGGGITGAVYEIGALQAIDDMLVDRTVNDFDIYVGTSAGSLVAAMLANKLSPREMMLTIDDSHPEVRSIQTDDIFQSNFQEIFGRLARLPNTFWRTGRTYLSHFREMTLADLLWEFTELLPTGLYSGESLEHYIQEILTRPGCLNRFDFLEKELYIVATDLDSGERTVFGKDGKEIVPISKAVAASSAVPLLYKPVRIYGKEYVDGGVRGTASIDLAIEAGANLVVCINPLVPLDAKKLYQRDEHIGDEGIRSIVRQVIRVVMHSGLRYHIKSLRKRYPDVDIILIEPRPDDQQMFLYDLMDYGSRLRVANHGFESVTVGLSERFAYFRGILSRHNIEISPRLVNEELREIRASGYDSHVLRYILERSHRRHIGPNDTLQSSLSKLELNLDRLDQLIQDSH